DLTARNDDVLGTVLELDIAVGVHDAEVAGMEPAAGKRRLSRRFVPEVTFHDHVAAHHDFAQRFPIGRYGSQRFWIEHTERFQRRITHALTRLLYGLLGSRQRI